MKIEAPLCAFVQASDMSVQCDELHGCQESKLWRLRRLVNPKLSGAGRRLEGLRDLVSRV